MIKGEKKVDVDAILERMSPYYVYKMYMPWEFELNKKCRNPFVSSDDNPSFIIGNKFGVITFKAFNSDNRGDCIGFVMQLFNLDRRGAIIKIGTDFGMLENSKKYDKLIKLYPDVPKIVKLPQIIQVKAGKWTEFHKNYFQAYNLTHRDLNFAEDTKVYAVKEWALNRSKMPLKENEIAFAYNLTNERGDWVKIYKPEGNKKEKWMSSIPFTELHNRGAINGGCDIGIITKSLKDAAWINKYITHNVEVMQAEDICALSLEDGKRMLKSCKKLYICFDNDKKGKQASIALTKELECSHINVPDFLLEQGVTDMTDWVKLAGNQPVIDFFKQKGVI